MQAFANTLVRFIHQHGGKVHLGTPVKRIRVENGRAAGITLGDGTMLDSDRVISAADLHHTCLDLIGRKHLTPGMIAKLEAARPSEPVFAVFLGLRESPEMKSAFERFHEPHVIFTCADGRTIQIAWLDKDDASIVPAGKHSLFVGWLDDYKDWESLKGDNTAYQARKAAVTGRIPARPPRPHRSAGCRLAADL